MAEDRKCLRKEKQLFFPPSIKKKLTKVVKFNYILCLRQFHFSLTFCQSHIKEYVWIEENYFLSPQKTIILKKCSHSPTACDFFQRYLKLNPPETSSGKTRHLHRVNHENH